MRIVKDADERKNEILDAAEKLFLENGFDKTSISDVLKNVGIARGTLYYHFDSKESIMDAIIERYNKYLLDSAGKIAADKSIPVYERIIKTVLALKIKNMENIESEREIMGYIHKPGNLLMHRKIQKSIVKNVTPMLSDIINDGIEQGLFSTPYPYECMEMVLLYANSVFDDDVVEMDEENTVSRVRAFIFNIERLLGAEPGSFPFSTEMLLKGHEGDE